MLKVGIVGLPNVGKSTLFNALLKKQTAHVANYPFATIEPNVGVVDVPDDRLPVLAKIVGTEKLVPASVEFFDIAGLVAGAHKGEGLGNTFLAHIREVAVIVHVVRLFENKDITHVSDTIDPQNDIDTIESELILADLATLSKQNRPNKKLEKEDELFFNTVETLRGKLDKGTPARLVTLSDKERESVEKLNLLTIKPVIYAFNVSEAQLENKEVIDKKIHSILDSSHPDPELAEGEGSRSNASLDSSSSTQNDKTWIYLCAKLETEIVALADEDQKEYLKQFGLEESGLNRLIKKAYETLGLISYLTAGVKEARAWTVRKGALAPEAAGVIHTDFEKKFIKAEVVSFDQFVELGGWAPAREKGKVKLAGREYVMQDGDVVDFKIGA